MQGKRKVKLRVTVRTSKQLDKIADKMLREIIKQALPEIEQMAREHIVNTFVFGHHVSHRYGWDDLLKQIDERCKPKDRKGGRRCSTRSTAKATAA